MLSKKLQDALNAQIQVEMASSYTYLAMAAWFESQNMSGQAKWMRKQADEERAHAMKIFDFVNDRDGTVVLQAMPKPAATFASVQDAWKKALAHEQKVSKSINALYELATKEKDYATQALMQWFVTEQVEEEATARAILEQATMIGSGTSLYFFDRHLGKDAGE